MKNLSERQCIAIQAALRYWQNDAGNDDDLGKQRMASHFSNSKPLTMDEIDQLCETLNDVDPIEVVISVKGGVADLVKCPKGVRVKFKDYDDDPDQDKRAEARAKALGKALKIVRIFERNPSEETRDLVIKKISDETGFALMAGRRYHARFRKAAQKWMDGFEEQGGFVVNLTMSSRQLYLEAYLPKEATWQPMQQFPQ